MKFVTCLVFVLVSFSATSCENNKFSKIQKIDNDGKILQFIPDTSLNKILFIQNPNSILKFLGDISPLLNHDEDLPSACFFNKSKQQYVKFIFLPGGTANTISQFEVGYYSDNINPKNCFPIELDSLYTESKIALGLTKAEILKIKGNNYKNSIKGISEMIIYSLDDFDREPFLKRYNMPVYVEEFYFKNDRLTRFRFGFEYP